MKRTIEIDFLRYGQPRPYADSEYEAVITFGGDQLGKPSREQVIEIARWMVHGFKTEDEGREWHEPYLKSLEQVSETSWQVHIVSPFLD